MAITTNPFDMLPKEIHCLEILSKLDADDLGQCLFVSRQWRELASDDQVWRVMLQSLAPGVRPPSKGIQAYFSRHAVTTIQDVISHLESFTLKARLFQKNSFKCFFPYNEGCQITAELGRDRPHLIEINDFCIFMRKLGTNPSAPFNSTAKVGRYLIWKTDIVIPARGEVSLIPLEQQIEGTLEQGVKKMEDEARVVSAMAIVAVAASVLGRLQAQDRTQ